MRVIFLVAIALMVQFSMLGQYSERQITEESSFRDRVFAGGGLGLGFGNVDWVNVSPIIGYRITDRLAGGVGITYRYANYKLFNPRIKTNDYGGSLFGRYLLKSPIFLQAEYEYLNFEIASPSDDSTRLGFSSFLAGGGMSQPLGERAAFVLTALYNFSYDSGMTPYDDPWIVRGGITFGF